MFHAVILFVDFSAFLVEPPLRIRITVDLIDEFPSRIAQPSHPIEIQRVSGKGFGGAEDRFPVHQRLRRFEFHPRTFENGGDYEIRAIKIFGNIFHGSYHFDVIAFQIVFQRFEPFAYNQDLCVYMRSDMLNEPPDTVLIRKKKTAGKNSARLLIPAFGKFVVIQLVIECHRHQKIGLVGL